MTSPNLVIAKWAVEALTFDELPLLMEWMAEKGFYWKGDDSGFKTVAEIRTKSESQRIFDRCPRNVDR